MLYAGPNHTTTTGYIGTSDFMNGRASGPMYVGYMYGTSGSLANNRTNTNDSAIKKTIDTWYKNDLLSSYGKYISKTAIYCSDRSTQNNSYSTSSKFYYSAYTRLADNKAPTYKCGGNTSDGLFESTQAIQDKFSASTTGGGNGRLTYPIAMMTADEVAFAGGKYATVNSSVWYYANSANSSIVGTNSWWLISPANANSSYSYVFYVRGNSNSYNPNIPSFTGRLDYTVVGYKTAIRPVISLKACVKYSSGNGTSSSPYEVTIDDACTNAEN